MWLGCAEWLHSQCRERLRVTYKETAAGLGDCRLYFCDVHVVLLSTPGLGVVGALAARGLGLPGPELSRSP